MSATTQQIAIVPASLDYLESYRQYIDSIAKERCWFAIVEAFPAEQTRDFVSRNLTEGNPFFFALEGDRVVGSAEIHREPHLAARRHCGTLGMGLHADYRGRGLGRQLLQAALEQARAIGLMRVELGVYVSNTRAIALYRSLGFIEEGRRTKGFYLDGRFDDILLMSLMLAENLPPDAR